MMSEDKLYGIVNEAGEWLGIKSLDDDDFSWECIYNEHGANPYLNVNPSHEEFLGAFEKFGGTIAHFPSGEPVNKIICRYDERTGIVSWHRLGEERAQRVTLFDDLVGWAKEYGHRYIFLVNDFQYISGSSSSNSLTNYIDLKTRTVHND